MIMRVRKYRQFVANDAFVEMISEVREWDRRSMPGASAWLGPPLQEALIVADAEKPLEQFAFGVSGKFQGHGVSRCCPERR